MQKSAGVVGGFAVGLLATPIPAYVGAWSLNCCCSGCANPIPALLMFPAPAALILIFRGAAGPLSLLAYYVAAALALIQLPVYGAALVSSHVWAMPDRRIALAIAGHLVIIALVLAAVAINGDIF